MRNEKIANRQLWFILFIIRSTIMLAFLPVLTSADARQDAWISALVTLLGTEIFVFLIALLNIRFPRLTLIEYSQKILGRWPGKVLGLGILWLFLEASVIDIRIYGEMIVTSFLPDTPLLYVVSVMVLAAVLCIYDGIEILGRAADLIFFLFLGMLIAVILIPLPAIELKNMQPVLARGWGPVIRGSLVPVALVAHLWFLGMLTPVLTEPEKMLKIALTSVGISLIILTVVALIVICVLGANEGSRANFPTLTLIRSIELSQFLQRTEVLIVFAWGFGLFIAVSTFLYSGAKGLSQLLNLKDYRSILWPMAVVWVFLSVYGFDNIFALFNFLKPETYATYGFAFLLIPLILLWTGYAVRALAGKMKGDN